MTETSFPKSPAEKTGGMVYFARMLDKIRLQAAGQLGPDYQDNYGQGMDGWCTDFLRVAHADLAARVAEGGTDEEILEWCQTRGRELSRSDIFIWNQFALKLGWNDIGTKLLNRLKAAGGFEGRDDVITMMQFMDLDEGRMP
jgi:hypothetical protein